jgi:diguanylate cyclase (GGDEF)-like protein
VNSPEPADPPTVLIVDDDPVMRMLAQETLSAQGFAVREAADGEQALDLLATRPPELILLDVEMPGMSGFAVCRHVRARWDASALPVIMVTAMDDLDSINHAYEAGATDFIAKPINWPSLGHRTRYVLRSARAARNLRALEEKQAAIVRAMPDTIFVLRRDGTYLDYKEGYGAPPGATPGAFPGGNIAAVLPAPVTALLRRTIALALDQGALHSAHYQLPLPDGIHYYEARIAPSGVDQVVAILRDITALKLNEEKVRRLAYFDPLTGMPNRLHFIERVDSDLRRARQENLRLALLFLDLDGFKHINDTFGHSAGDGLLQAVAARLKEQLRASDMVERLTPSAPGLHFARLGGDEFTITLPDIKDSTSASLIAERALTVLALPFEIAGQAITVTASIGIAVFPEDGSDAAALLKHADTAMYHAKDQGRNNWQLYHKTLTNKAMTRLSLENDLRRGLARHEFHLVYQPQVLAQGGAIIGMEALLRWQHPLRGPVSPAQFIPLAEESGLIVPLGQWVIRTACQQVRAWQREGLPTPRVAVNVAARQLRAPDFVGEVIAIIAETGINANLLELELTESVLMDPDEWRIAELHRLRALGVRFSLDDFGTGYSSMTYVKRFPIAMLKIDMSFVRGLPHNGNDAGITTAILAMARSLDLDVIAEGVETSAQHAFLLQARCPKLQGYLFSHPVPPAAMAGLLRQGTIRAGANAALAA